MAPSLTLIRGDDYTVTVNFTNTEIAGYDATLTIRQRINDDEPLIRSHSVVEPDGTCVFTLTNRQTDTFPVSNSGNAVMVVMDVQVTSPSGSVKTLVLDGVNDGNPQIQVAVHTDVTRTGDKDGEHD